MKKRPGIRVGVFFLQFSGAFRTTSLKAGFQLKNAYLNFVVRVGSTGLDRSEPQIYIYISKALSRASV